MRADLAPQLRCPACLRDRTLTVTATESDERELREGVLHCGHCGREFPVHRGVAELLYDPPAYIVTEADGLARFAVQMRAEGWTREMVLALPEVAHGYWYVQARSMHQLLTAIGFQPGESILDVGSNTCWAANHFAERGLRAFALDIVTAEMQGLYTADYFLEAGRSYFERILGSMDRIPLASETLDYVYCCEVLHHNDEEGLARTFAEAFRVLRPGGRLLMVNETLKTLRDPSGVHTEGIEQWQGYEHAHWAWRYRWLATRAGFFTDVIEPHYVPFFGDSDLELPPDTSARRARAIERGFALRSNRLARRAYLEWCNNVWGGVSMNMIATKPTRWLGTAGRVAGPARLGRTLAAATRLRTDRDAGLAPLRLPRSPEEIMAAYEARVRGEAPSRRPTPASP